MKAREIGPVPWGHSVISSLRYLIWQSVRLGLKIWNLWRNWIGREWRFYTYILEYRVKIKG